MTQQIDQYSTNELPFLVAQWMRRNKYHKLSVEATKVLQQMRIARKAVDEAYAQQDKCLRRLQEISAQVEGQIDDQS